MEMVDLKAFRRANNLKQKDLADILGVSRGFIGQIECGHSKLPEEYLRALLGNKNYDTSMLVIDSPITTVSARASGNSSARISIGRADNAERLAVELAMSRSEIESLRSQLAEEKQRSAQYWEMIQKLMK